MNLYEHTIVARQDATANQIKQLTEKYSKIIEEFDGSIIQTQNWGLLNYLTSLKRTKKVTIYISKSRVLEKLLKN